MEIPKLPKDFMKIPSLTVVDYEAITKAFEDIEPNVHSQQLDEIKKLREIIENKSYQERHPIKWNVGMLIIGGLITELIRFLIEIAK